MNEYTAETQTANRIAAQLRGLPTPQHRARVQVPKEPRVRKSRAYATGVRGKSEYLRVKARARTAEVLAFCHQFFAENDQLPPQAAIAAHLGVDEQVAQKYMRRLGEAGQIERNAVGKWRFARKGAAA